MKSFVYGACAALFGGVGAAPAGDVQPLAQPVAREAAQQSCQPVNFRIYFPKESTEITPDGRALINAAVRSVAGCERVTVLFGADHQKIMTEENRAQTSERSAEILNVLRQTGVAGDVYVGEADEALFKNGRNFGGRSTSPDFIHVAVAPETSTQAVAGAPEYRI